MLQRVKEMDAIPCYIQIFRLYHECEMIESGKKKMNKDDQEGFMAYAYLFWYSSIFKHMKIGKNIKSYIKEFFMALEKRIGGISEARKKADQWYSKL
jgi:hypothetical protein